MPFRRMNPKKLPIEIANRWSIDWRPIMNKMLEAPGLPDGIENILNIKVMGHSRNSKCTNAQTHKRTNAQTHKRTNAQMHTF